MASHALVDYPRVDAEQVKTKADEKATGARPTSPCSIPAR
jgi:hypothetical protein